MVNDTVADMITRIRNANLVRQTNVQVIASNTTNSIASILKDEGFVEKIQTIETDSGLSSLLITLKYQGKRRKPYITALKRISKPGLRVYANSREIPRVLGGIGIAIISTSKGIMTDRRARHEKVGGEILCYVW
uniref:Small ribosomal subunit protein uS8c n=1 Tax=Chlorokybus atmophyticus TaxID=3144 RepID=RR8_CHLAT|nr:ribosomal protein S8 [Chlorokybus atmophyticus]Q19VB3.2 RecName: Full=Small ribosomal subunit protein uS8c; AltName: Full=30S ribosomal protein S8, chloroplastic [Chlorokybus atmophyticus]ABD62254.2 ribosomal protein S8 [Chlorokybus atmophyticus]